MYWIVRLDYSATDCERLAVEAASAEAAVARVKSKYSSARYITCEGRIYIV
jgi:hypothetical protein